MHCIINGLQMWFVLQTAYSVDIVRYGLWAM